MVRKRMTVRASEVEPGDYVELERTSAGIELPKEQTLVLDVHDVVDRDDGQNEGHPQTWLQLDTSGVEAVRPNWRLGSFLASDREVTVWRLTQAVVP